MLNSITPRLPKPVTLAIMQKPFTPGYLWIAAWQGQEATGPFGHGDDQRQAINQLVDVTEEMFAEESA